MKHLIIWCFFCIGFFLFQFAGIRETLKHGKRRLLSICIWYCPHDGELIAFWLMSPSELCLSWDWGEGGERKQEEISFCALPVVVSWDVKKGLKSPKAGGAMGWWWWWEGRGGNHSLGVCQRGRRERNGSSSLIWWVLSRPLNGEGENYLIKNIFTFNATINISIRADC